jgi:hypothetical protein
LLAQLVEQRTFNPVVVGLTPLSVGVTNFIFGELVNLASNNHRLHEEKNMDAGLVVLVLVAFLAFLVGLFWIFRTVMLWYWRINESIILLTSIDKKLGQLTEQSFRQKTEGNMAPLPSRSGTIDKNFEIIGNAFDRPSHSAASAVTETGEISNKPVKSQSAHAKTSLTELGNQPP